MSTITAPATGAAAYEYLTVAVPKGKGELYRDTYRSLGWTSLDDAVAGNRLRSLHLKRDRRLRGDVELRRLEADATAALERIESLERSRTTLAAFTGWFIGGIGTAMLAYSLLTMQHDTSFLVYLLGLGGIVEWAISPLLYRVVRGMRTRQAKPKIAQQYDLVYAATEHAHRLVR
jgi:hypothetical protein